MTPQQIVESFLQESAAIAAASNARLMPLHAKYFGMPLLEYAHNFLKGDKVNAVVEDVSQSLDSAIVITGEPWVQNEIQRKRYHLSLTRVDWKIIGIESECLLCKGDGRKGRTACNLCGGSGWKNWAKDTS
jgi:hypothetical protein